MSILLSELLPKTCERIIQKALRANQRRILQVLPKKLAYPNGQVRAVDWQRKSAKDLCEQVVQMMYAPAFEGQRLLDREIIKIWANSSAQKTLIEQVRTALANGGYQPLSTLRFDEPSRRQLRSADIAAEGRVCYYRPANSDLAQADPEEVTLLAHLLGWTAMPLANVAPIPDLAASDTFETNDDEYEDEDADFFASFPDDEELGYLDPARTSELDHLTEAWPHDPLVAEVQRVANGLFEVWLALQDGQIPAVSIDGFSLAPLITDYNERLAAVGTAADSLADPALLSLRYLLKAEAKASEHYVIQATRATQRQAALAELDLLARLTAAPRAREPLTSKALSGLAAAVAEVRAAVVVEEEAAITQLATGVHWLAVARRLADQSLAVDQLDDDSYSCWFEERSSILTALDKGWICLGPASSTDQTPIPDSTEPEILSTDLAAAVEACTAHELVATNEASGTSLIPELADEPIEIVASEYPTAAATTSLGAENQHRPAEDDHLSVAESPPPEQPTEQGVIPASADAPAEVAPIAAQPVTPAAQAAETTLAATPPTVDVDALGIISPASGAEVAHHQWRLLAQGELSLAYHLARAYESLFTPEDTPDDGQLPAWLVEALLLSRHLQSPDEAVAKLLMDVSSRFVEVQLTDSAAEAGGARRLLAWAAALQPALLAPETQLNGWLSIGGVPHLPQLAELVQKIAQRQSFEPLGADLIGSVQNAQEWENDSQRWRDRLAVWEREQQQVAFRGSASNDIVKLWRGIFNQKRAVGRILVVLRTPDTTNMGEVEQLIVDLQLLSSADRKELIAEAKLVGIN